MRARSRPSRYEGARAWWASVTRSSDPDSGMAILVVVMVMLIFATVSGLMLTSVVVQYGPASFQGKAGRTISAAEAGLDTALAALRSARSPVNGVMYGDRTKLPCWTGQTGAVGGPQGSTVTWRATISYYSSDPSSQDDQWRAENALTCTTGAGTAKVPAFAMIQSAGAGPGILAYPQQVGDRAMEAVYEFSTTNPKVPGGPLKDYNGLCYQGSLTAGRPVTMETCQEGLPTQLWSYEADHLLRLPSTANSDGSGGLCLTARPATAGSQRADALVTACDTADPTEQWGVSATFPAHIYGHLTWDYDTSWCLGPAAPGVAGSALIADRSTCNSTQHSITPDARVGPGAAGTTAPDLGSVDGVPMRWVNFQDFGRCLDITGFSLEAAHHLVYPCKQDPMAAVDARASPDWNQVFTYSSATHRFSVSPPAPEPTHCMFSPGIEDGLVLFDTTCAAAVGDSFWWSVQRSTSDVKTRYTIKDAWGRCLSTGPRNGVGVAYAVTQTCDGSDAQKWNAPAAVGDAAVQGITEVGRS
jgi:hypothetical protein